MSAYVSKFKNFEEGSQGTNGERLLLQKPHRWLSFTGWLFATLAAAVFLTFHVAPAYAQTTATPSPSPTPISNPCPTVMFGQTLILARDRSSTVKCEAQCFE